MDGRLPAGVSRRVLLAAVVALSLTTAGVVGYRLADPADHDLDLAESPDEIAYDALSQLDHRDYAVAWRIPPAPDDEGGGSGDDAESSSSSDHRVFLSATVEGSENRIRTQSGGTVLFADENCRWSARSETTKPDTDGPDRCDPDRRLISFYGLEGDWAAVREPDANVTVLRETETALVLRVNDTDTAQYLLSGRDDISESEYARERDLRANLTLVVDRDAGHLRRVVFRQSALSETDEENLTREYSRHVYTFSKWDRVTVERPDWAGYSLKEFLADVTR
ncbi:hypothetical protein [Halorussus pelagicus]|uniref:hypothetical protein n=1 Tax=Halorussus pelagicus TaxID=2505977 RepID=UPI000FFB3750|nr:hypothetical protein [Halorussus pelagicus]